MSFYFWSALLLSLRLNVCQNSLYGGTCGKNQSRVFAERLVYRFSYKLEEGFRDCAWRCVKNLLCETFSTKKGSCHLYTRNGNSVLATFDDKCKIDEDCNYQHGQCLEGFCSCEVGHSFNFEKNLCVKACPSYGSHFSVYKDRAIIGRNTKPLVKMISIEECVAACRDEKSFVCINADFSKRHRRCHLCNTTWADTALDHRGRNMHDWILIYRHCLRQSTQRMFRKRGTFTKKAIMIRKLNNQKGVYGSRKITCYSGLFLKCDNCKHCIFGRICM